MYTISIHWLYLNGNKYLLGTYCVLRTKKFTRKVYLDVAEINK